ncbi:MAG: adenylate/guanylate cyclase domain-containing protein [Chloroflexota bacterium]
MSETGTVISPSGSAERFEAAFSRAVLQSERLRVGLVVLLLVGLVVRWLFLWFVFPGTLEAQLGGSVNLGSLAVLGAATVAYEVAVLVRLTLMLRGDKPLPTPLRYLNAAVEVSIPTFAMLVGPVATSPAYVLQMPPAWGYFVFIILSTLRLDFKLCLFTGLVAGLEYALLGLYFLTQPQNGPIDPLFTAPIQHGTRVLILVASGLVAGIVSLQIRQQFFRALRSIDEQNRIVGMFGQHVSPAVVERLLSQDVELGGEVRHVCVMFLDIEGFTTFSESRRPEEVVEYLNSLFAVMIDSVNDHHGIVNKFLGDGFMAVFGAPIADASDCQNAVRASLEIIQKIDAMSASGEIAPTRIRIGLHAGEAVTGNVGSTARKEYTIIGDVVNLASRLEQLNKQFGSRLMVSETVVQRLDGQVELAATAKPHGEIQVKGREQPVQVYELA